MSIPSEAASSEPMLASEGPLESDVQVAALVDDGWQLRRRPFTSWGLANSIGLGAGGGGSRGGGGGEASSGDVPPETNGSGESVTLPTQTHEEGTRLPSEGLTDGSTNASTDGSSDENSGSSPGEDLNQPVQNQPPQNQPPAKHDGTNPHEEEVVEPDPIDDGGSGPIYFPPEEMKPPVVQVPEPTTWGLLGLGLIGCAVARRRRAR